MSKIVIDIKGVDGYPSIYGAVMEQLEDNIADAVMEQGFDNFTVENTYTGNSITKIPAKELSREG